jgi:alkylation response protein AidB-like acyl-CoA dehydrogenase
LLRNSLDSILLQTREIAREVVSANADRCDREARWPEESIRAMQSAGLAGLVVPQVHGGLGHGLVALAQVCEILGQECASTAICFGMHCVGSSVIAANVTPAQLDRFLAPIVEGRHITTLSLSEAGTGVHFYLPQTRLRSLPDSFVLEGTKTFVTNGGYADSYVVSTVLDAPDAPPGQFSCVIVPGKTPGLEWGPPWNGLGLRGNSSRSLKLSGVEIPRANLVGREGEQIWYIFNVVCPYFLISIAGTYLGVASAALTDIRNYLGQRHHSHSGQTLAQAPVLQHRLAALWSMVERTRRLIYFAASSFDAGDPDALVAMMASKVEVAECVVNVVNEAMTLAGGIAYRGDSRLHRMLRDARAVHLMSPSTDILRTWIGRALLGLPLLSD